VGTPLILVWMSEVEKKYLHRSKMGETPK
jgi:hypothetical protein